MTTTATEIDPALESFLRQAQQDEAKVYVTLSERCKFTGLEGKVVKVSTTGALVVVRAVFKTGDGHRTEQIEVPTTEITNYGYDEQRV